MAWLQDRITDEQEWTIWREWVTTPPVRRVAARVETVTAIEPRRRERNPSFAAFKAGVESADAG